MRKYERQGSTCSDSTASHRAFVPGTNQLLHVLKKQGRKARCLKEGSWNREASFFYEPKRNRQSCAWRKSCKARSVDCWLSISCKMDHVHVGFCVKTDQVILLQPVQKSSSPRELSSRFDVETSKSWKVLEQTKVKHSGNAEQTIPCFPTQYVW